MTAHPMVIVGAGQAGGRAALALREAGWRGAIVLIGKEQAPPYERPPLSQAFLQRAADANSITFASRERLAEHNIQFVGGVAVTAIDREAKQVVLADDRSVPYGKLLIATGRRPRRIRIPGSAGDAITYLRTIVDAENLRSKLRPGASIAIIGGGLIGLEVAASASLAGCRVTVFELAPRLLSRAVPEAIARRLQDRHEQAGVAIGLGIHVEGLEHRPNGALALSAGGRSFPCDLVLAGVGATPRTELAETAGLALDSGILVDDRLRTSDPDIYAAGDVTAFPTEAGLLRLECWKNADDQGTAAALNMLGADEAYHAVPWFSSDQYELSLQIAGTPERGIDESVRDSDSGTIHFHLDQGGRLVGASGVGPSAIGRDIRAAQIMIERGIAPDPAVLADPGQSLKTLLKAAQAAA
jgi:3-phenylpropionate/trans-cinnamate dioxygenase ferredoxin reductase subunit